MRYSKLAQQFIHMAGVLLLTFPCMAQPVSAAPANPPVPVITSMATESSRIGMNAGMGAMDWDPTEMFADTMKTFRSVTKPDGNPVNVDTQGWPLADCKFLVWHGLVRPAGIYKLKLIGKPGLISADGGSVQNQLYNATNNSTTADVVLAGANYLYLTFTGTTNGVKNVQMMKPGHAFTETWSHDFLTAIEPVKVIRFMDFTATNWSKDVNWSDRTLPDAASQQNNAPSYGWQGKGIAWEYVIDLLNTTHKDGWINIPAEANDGYVSGLISLIKNGAGGFAPLETSAKLYIEYSNEVWNSGFDQFIYNHNQAIAEVNAGNSPLNFDGETNDWYWAWRRVAMRIVEISQQFRASFGDAQMMTRFRPILAWQIDNGQATGEMQLDFIQKYYGTNQWGYANPRPVNEYLWGGGGALYSDDVPLAQDSAWKTAVRTDSMFAATYGIHYISYEGGIEFDGSSDPAWGETWVTQDTVARQQFFEENGGSLFMFYSLMSDYNSLGILKDIRDLNTPKYNAYLQLTQQAQAWQNTLGASIPMNSHGAAFSLAGPSWLTPGSGASTVLPNQWRAYHFDANANGIYRTWIEYRSSTTINLNLYAGSEKIATLETNTGASVQTSPTYTFSAANGLQAVRVENYGNSNFDIIAIHVELEQVIDYPLVISALRADTNPSSAATLHYSVIFSTEVSGVDAGDFALVSSGLNGVTINAVSGSGTNYSVTVNTGSGNGSLRLDVLDDDSILNLAGTPLGGTGVANGGFTGETYSIDRSPGPFEKTAPAPASAVGNTLTLSWTTSLNANSYEYCIDTSNDNTCSSWISTGSATSKFVSGLVSGTRYYWQVRAINGSGSTFANGSPTAYRSFMVVKRVIIPSAAAYDGWTLENSETGGIGANVNAITSLVMGDNAMNKQFRSLLFFATGGLPDNATITKATLKIKKINLAGFDPFLTHGQLVADIRTGAFNNSNALQAADFQGAASLTTIGSFSRATPDLAWYQLVLKSSQLTKINKTGPTQFRLRFSRDDDDDYSADFIRFYPGEAALSNQPVLILEYILP